MTTFCGCNNPDIVSETQGSTLILTCLSCGNSITTTDSNVFKNEKWEDDQTTYQIWLNPDNVDRNEFVKLFQQVTNSPIIESAEKYKTGKITLLFEGKGRDFYLLISRLINAGIEYETIPLYPHA